MKAVVSSKKTVTIVTGSISIAELWDWIRSRFDVGPDYTEVVFDFPDSTIYPLEHGSDEPALNFRIEREQIDNTERPVDLKSMEDEYVANHPQTKKAAKKKAEAAIRRAADRQGYR